MTEREKALRFLAGTILRSDICETREGARIKAEARLRDDQVSDLANQWDKQWKMSKALDTDQQDLL